MESLRPKKTYNAIFEPFPDDIDPLEVVQWKREIEAIWEGWEVTWSRVAHNQFAITCKPLTEEPLLN